ncbi:MAG TPA: DUF1194 domain-containing protein [Arenibaculum sp.]|nr:DUF1194 domain-containing protein [Arenibaculum sp.]
MPVRTILLGIFLLFQFSAASARAQAVDLELVLAADGSGSIDDEELKLQREGYARAITSSQVLDAIRSGPIGAIAMAYVEWGGADSQHTIVDWRVIHDEAAAAAFADVLLSAPRAASGWNSISGAIDYAADLIETNGIDGARRIIDVSGDGPHSGGRPVQAARDEAVMSGITINALVVAARLGYPGPAGEPLDQHYERDVIGGPGAFVMVARDQSLFRDAVMAKMVREIAGLSGKPDIDLAAR